MPRSSADAVTLPLRPADLFVLLVLEEQDLHGYGVMKATERLSEGDVRIDIGSLYRIVARMTTSGLVEDAPDAASNDRQLADERRRYYRITPVGRRTLKAELARLKSVVAIGASRGLLGSRGKSR
jgi:DNA-binding PadR family transcriptional regulator